MNIKVFALLVVFCAVIIVETDAWRFRLRLRRIRIRVRRIWDRIKKPFCNVGCNFGCNALIPGAPCRMSCRTVCGRRRRDTEELEDGRTVIPLPHKFSDYDLSNDECITLEEFAKFLEVDPANVEEAFNLANTRGDPDDDCLTQEEFENAPWYFDDDDDDDSDGTGGGPGAEDEG